MANVKITDLTADASPTLDDLIETVTDPAGTPASRKVTLASLQTLIAGLVWLETQIANNSASLDFAATISASYSRYLFLGEELVLQTSTANLLLEIGTGGGPTYDTGNNYEWAFQGLATDGTGHNDNGSTGIARVFLSMGTTAGFTGAFHLVATGLQSTVNRKTFHGHAHYISSSPLSIFSHGGIQWTTTGTAATAVRFIPSTGQIVSGKITSYGYR